MNAKHFVWILLSLSVCAPLYAQLSDSFEVISARTSLPSAIQNDAEDIALSQYPEVLISQRRYNEAASLYRSQIHSSGLAGDNKKREQACIGLYRAMSLSKKSIRADAFSECSPSTTEQLFGNIDRPAMFLNNPEFSAPIGWLNTAEPGVVYKVKVNFDIDEKGKAKNFSFPLSEGYYLQFPVISALRNTRYLPAIKNQKPVKSSGNVVQVLFCMERGQSCNTQH